MRDDNWVYDANPAMFRAHPVWFSLLLISVVGWPVLLIWWIRHKGARLALSEQEVLLERGLLARQRTQISLSSIRSVRITQSFGQRLFDVGDVELFSAGDIAEIAIRAMPHPGRIRDLAAARSATILPPRPAAPEA
jgi:uncharacterized membrane protein YdbT with pleckstrin-like domain